jgi:hypothetical protein
MGPTLMRAKLPNKVQAITRYNNAEYVTWWRLHR